MNKNCEYFELLVILQKGQQMLLKIMNSVKFYKDTSSEAKKWASLRKHNIYLSGFIEIIEHKLDLSQTSVSGENSFCCNWDEKTATNFTKRTEPKQNPDHFYLQKSTLRQDLAVWSLCAC